MSLKAHEPFRFAPREGWWDNRAIDPAHCRASVYPPGCGSTKYQCQRAAKLPTDPGGPLEWRKMHAPSTQAAKRAAWEDRYRKEERMRAMENEAKECATLACDALVTGWNDFALGYAQRRRELLDQLAKEKQP